MSDLPSSVLFVCFLNSIRSPIAEGLMRKHFVEQIYVRSCGEERGELDTIMVGVMREVGVDMEGHVSQSFDDLNDASFDLVIALTDNARKAAEAAFEGLDVEFETWTTPDPSAGVIDVRSMMNNYRAVRDNIEARIKRRFGETNNKTENIA